MYTYAWLPSKDGIRLGNASLVSFALLKAMCVPTADRYVHMQMDIGLGSVFGIVRRHDGPLGVCATSCFYT
jgi:hypothetical protein